MRQHKAARRVALLVAGGSGARCGAVKQFSLLGGRAMLWHAAQPFVAAMRRGDIDGVRVVAAADKAALAEEALGGLAGAGGVQVLAAGGDTRARSVYNGLAELAAECWVLVHDAARPCLSDEACARLLDFISQAEGRVEGQAESDAEKSGGGEVDGGADGAVLALPVSEALKTVRDGRLLGTVGQQDIWRMQTPQVFRAGLLRRALAARPQARDEAEAVLAAGGSVCALRGCARNIKVTYADDLILAAALLQAAGEEAAGAVSAVSADVAGAAGAAVENAAAGAA